MLAVSRSGLPTCCDRFLHPPECGSFFASRAWYDTTLAHALPAGSEPLLAICGAEEVLLPLLRVKGRIQSLTTPYTLTWQPLVALGAGSASARKAGHDVGRLFRFGPPARLEAIDTETPCLDAFLLGVREAGLFVQRYHHFGNWHEVLPRGLDWTGYLSSRPPELRTTIRRKLARCLREMRFEWVTTPGPALEEGIAAYEEVRARSWKPHEPFPGFDPALMRAASTVGVLRLAVLRSQGDGRAVAAQYWIVTGGKACLLKLAHTEDQRAASPGTVLTAMAIGRLLEDGTLRELDFGRGDDSYKRLWVGRRRQRIGVMLTDPRHPSGVLEIVRQAVGWSSRHACGWLRRGAAEKPSNRAGA